jgi:hypothetical protein
MTIEKYEAGRKEVESSADYPQVSHEEYDALLNALCDDVLTPNISREELTVRAQIIRAIDTKKLTFWFD